MTVIELIELLSRLDGNREVKIYNHDYYEGGDSYSIDESNIIVNADDVVFSLIGDF